MRWESVRDLSWERNFAEAKRFYEKQGHLLVNIADKGANGVALGRWIRGQREAYGTLSEDRKKKLDALGMVWQLEDPWNTKFRLVQRYYEIHGHTNMPADYVVDGVWLRRWPFEQKARLNGKATGRSKTAKTLTPEQIQQLSTVGIIPRKVNSDNA